jgi:hypothetical protein
MLRLTWRSEEKPERYLQIFLNKHIKEWLYDKAKKW